MNLSEDQILTLAPDDSSRKSGKELANPGKWVTKGVNELALWGECQGSGSKPYQTQIDIVNIAFKCSCPSRKFPCKHGLGLLLLYTKQPASFNNSEAPASVADWLSKRTEKQEKQAEKKDKPVDEVAQAKRQQARQSKVSDGIAELNTWIKDMVRTGIMTMPEKGPAFFENMARRMVDAQAPGLAGMIKILGEVNFYTDNWPTTFMDHLLRIYMVAEGYRNMATLNESMQQDIRTWIGFTQSQDELKEKKGIADTWLILSKESYETDGVTTERTWLYGTTSKQPALILQFIVRGQGIQHNLMPGVFLRAELVFFPSSSPLRAIIKGQTTTSQPTQILKFETWQRLIETETELNTKIPFRAERPFLIEQLKPVQMDEEWWLQDRENKLMRLKKDYKRLWSLLSVSGGNPSDMAVIGKEDRYEPVGIWQQDEYLVL